MAIFYTDFLTGNDSTGTGTWANPYKTIYRATQVINGNDDEVRVKGSGWTDLPGTITLTNNGITGTTSVDLTSFFPELGTTAGNAKVVISINDEWGIGKTVITAVADNATTLTLHNGWAGKSGTYTLKRLTTQHYYATTNPTSPTGVSGYFDAFDIDNMIDFTGLQITGGWTADGVRDGMTAFVNAGGNATNSQYRGISGINPNTTLSISRASTWYFAGFACINLISFNQDNALGQMGDFWFVRSTAQFGVSNALMWNRPGVIPNFYLYDCAGDTGSRWLGEGNSGQPLFNLNLWHSVPQSPIGSGNRSINGNGKIFNEYRLRGNTSTSSGSMNGATGYFAGGTYSRMLLINNFYYSKNNTGLNQYFALGNSFAAINYVKIDKVFIEDVNLQSGVYFAWAAGTSTEPVVGAWYLGDGTQTLTQLAVGNIGNNGSQDYTPSFISSKGFIVNSSEGRYRWVTGISVDTLSILVGESNDFVTGTNALKLKFNKITTGLASAPTYRVPVAVLPDITTPKTLTIKAKAEAATVGTYNITLWAMAPTGFGLTPSPNIMQGLGNMTLTTTYQDFVFNINPATWPGPYPYPNTVYYVYVQYTAGIGSFPGDILIDSIELS